MGFFSMGQLLLSRCMHNLEYRWWISKVTPFPLVSDCSIISQNLLWALKSPMVIWICRRWEMLARNAGWHLIQEGMYIFKNVMCSTPFPVLFRGVSVIGYWFDESLSSEWLQLRCFHELNDFIILLIYTIVIVFKHLGQGLTLTGINYHLQSSLSGFDQRQSSSYLPPFLILGSKIVAGVIFNQCWYFHLGGNFILLYRTKSSTAHVSQRHYSGNFSFIMNYRKFSLIHFLWNCLPRCVSRSLY